MESTEYALKHGRDWRNVAVSGRELGAVRQAAAAAFGLDSAAVLLAAPGLDGIVAPLRTDEDLAAYLAHRGAAKPVVFVSVGERRTGEAARAGARKAGLPSVQRRPAAARVAQTG